MAHIGELVATLKVDSSGLKSGLSSASSHMNTFSSRSGSSLRRLGKSVFNLKNAVLGLAGFGGLGMLAKSFISASNATESYRVRLNILLGSTKEANRLFQDMTAYATSVPFTYNKIMESATALSGVMKGGVDEIKKWMPMIGDLAAASGLSIEQTTSQIIRMYSAGASAADMFRERGILAMMGFKSGVKYSTEETKNMIIDSWESTTSKFRGAADALGGTWTGLVSMLSDRWFQFRDKVMRAGIFDLLKKKADNFIKKIDELTESGKIKVWAEYISNKVVAGFQMLEKSIIFVTDHWKLLSAVAGTFIVLKVGVAMLAIGSTAVTAAAGVTSLATAFGMLNTSLLAIGGLAGLAVGLTALVGYGAYAASNRYIQENQKYTVTIPKIPIAGPGQSPLKSWQLPDDDSPIFNLPPSSTATPSLLSMVPSPMTKMADISIPISPKVTISNGLEIERQLSDDMASIMAGKDADMAFPNESNNKSLENYIENQKKLQLQWDELRDTAPTISDPFKDAFADILKDGKTNLSELEDSFKDMFVNMAAEYAKQNFIQPMTESIMKSFGFSPGGTGFMSQPAFGGQQGDATWGQYAGGAAMAGMTAYSVYQNAQSGQMDQGTSTFTGAASGAVTGGAIGGPWGAVIGGVIGGAIGYFSYEDADDVTAPTLDVLYEIIDNKLKIIGDTWKNSDSSFKVIKTIEKTLQAQIDFYESALGLLHKSTKDFSGSTTFTGPTGGRNIDVGTGSHAAMQMIDLYQQGMGSVWKDFNDDFMAAWESGFGKFTEQTMRDIAKQEGEDADSFWTDLKATDKTEGTFAPEILEKIKQGDPDAFLNWLDTVAAGYYNLQDWTSRTTEYKVERTPGEMGYGKEFEAMTLIYQEKINNIVQTLSQGIGKAFLDSLQTHDFQTFKASFKVSIFESIQQGMIQGIMNTVMSDVIRGGLGGLLVTINEFAAGNLETLQIKNPYSEGEVPEIVAPPTVAGILAQSSAEGLTPQEALLEYWTALQNGNEMIRTGMSQEDMDALRAATNAELLAAAEATVAAYTSYDYTPAQQIENATLIGIEGLEDTMAGMEPAFEIVDAYFQDLAKSLGLNTDAIVGNTSASLSNTEAILGPVNSFLMNLNTGPLAPVQSIAGMASIEDRLFTEMLADPTKFAAYSQFMEQNMIPFQQGVSQDYSGYIGGLREQVEGVSWIQDAREKERALLLEIKEAIENNPPVVIVDGEIIGSISEDRLRNSPSFAENVRDIANGG